MQPTSGESPPTRILFVCLGNICRSPLAEGVFRHLVTEQGLSHAFHVDSAGTGGWHSGEPPDPRSVEVAEKHGIRLTGRARKVAPSDFSEFDLIVAMDQDNLRSLRRRHEREKGRARLTLLREFDPDPDGSLEVPDPYYGGRDGFEEVFQLVERSCLRLVHTLRGDAEPPPGQDAEGGPP